MSHPDDHQLWQDALDDGVDPAFAAASLQRTVLYARRRRQRRNVAGAVVAIGGACALLMLAARINAPWKAPAATRPVESVKSELAPVYLLTEDELLSRFPGRALALIGPPDHQQLVFLDD